MLKKLLLILLFICPFSGHAQTSVTGQVVEGPLAVRPAACAPGDLFFATDTFVLYQCGPTNTWTTIAGGQFAYSSGNSTASITLSSTGNAFFDYALVGNVTSMSIASVGQVSGTIYGVQFCQPNAGGVYNYTVAWPAAFNNPPFVYPGQGVCTSALFKLNGSATWDNVTNNPNLSIKPRTSDNICYVSDSVLGNDANDGLSIGTPKHTIYSCLTTVLPGGTSTTAGNGTVLLSGSPVYGGPVTNQGMWLMGPNDPNFASPPSGWLKANNIGPLTITLDCFATAFPGANNHTGHCGFTGGSIAAGPSVWISAIAGNITINNIGFPNYIGQYVRYGIDSNGNRNGSGGSSGFAMRNDVAGNGACTNPGQTGPVIDIGSNSFWIWFKELNLSGCSTKIFAVASSGAVRSSNVVTITTTAANDISTGELVTIANVTDDSFNVSAIVTVVDSTHFTYVNNGLNATSGTGQVVTARSAAINMDSGTTGSGTGLVFIDDSNLNGGGIRYRQGLNGGGFYVHNLSYEGTGQGPSGPPDPPVVLITGTSSTSNGDGTNIRIDDVEVSDPNVTAPGVRVDGAGGLAPDLVIVSRVAGYLRGKMTVLGNSSIIANPGTPKASYLSQQQYGMRNGQLIATGVDVARRNFSPTVARGNNLAIAGPSSWTFISGAGTITSGITAPDGTNNAGRVTYTSGSPSAAVQFYGSSATLNIGDYYIFGAWVRSNTANGYVSSVFPINFVFSASGFGNGDGCASPPAIYVNGAATVLGNVSSIGLNDGQWQWFSGVCKVGSNASTPGTSFQAYVDTNHTLEFYAPTLYQFPVGTISDDEAYEIAINMAPVPQGAVAGEVAMLPGQLFKEGTTLFANLTNPSNGDAIFCTDCAVANPCVGGGTGAFAQRIGGIWSCSIPNINLPTGIVTASTTLSNAIGVAVITATSTVTVPHALAGQTWFVYCQTGICTLAIDSGILYGNGSTGSFVIPVNTGVFVSADGTNAHAGGTGGGGGGGGCTPGGSQNAIQYNGGGTCSFGGVNSPVANGIYNVIYNVVAGISVAPTIVLPGVPVNPQTGTTYIIGNANTWNDRGTVIKANNSGAQTYTAVNPSTVGFGFNMFYSIWNTGTGAITENSSGFNINGSTSLLIPPNWVAPHWSDGISYFSARYPDFLAFPNCTGGGNALQFTSATGVFGCGSASAGVSSWTDNTGIYNNSTSTGAVVASLATAGANKVWANCTGSTATPSYCFIVDAMLTAASHAALYNGSNTWSGIQDFSLATWKFPAGAGISASAGNTCALDTTNKNIHCYVNNADAIVGAFANTPTNGDCVKAVVSSGNILLADAGTPCGSGGGSGIIISPNPQFSVLQPQIVYNTPSSSVNTNISAVNLVALTNTIHEYKLEWTASLTTPGTSCTGSTTVVLNAIFTNPSGSGSTTQALATITLATNSNGTAGFIANGVYPILASPGTAVQYSTSSFTAGSGCSPAPKYQIQTTLVQEW